MSEELKEFDLAEFMPEGQRSLFRNCRVRAPQSSMGALQFKSPPIGGNRNNVDILISKPNLNGNLTFVIGPGSAKIEIHTAGHIFANIRTWRPSTLRIGEGVTINSARMVMDLADVKIGENGLWSDEILLQSNDQHGIIDLETMDVVNAHRRKIEIGKHVWIGRRTTIMPDVRIGPGGILGAGSILTTDMPAKTIFGGIPAKKIKDNVSWCRSPMGPNEMEEGILSELKSGV
ncbi:hypothetical protein [Ponticaulis sp.]|uniref:acyltransferase n=1 Tax=Ponticaulis sp. TaxID=2020902 RepID=UPI000C46C4D0|nr:hypothetical protein [Ponticaulis sp.]MAF56730.1 hypothetical protein [Ponticaulis sp.]MBN05989.1 hypothetical protein [Ponticaulis sp.]